jgi:hypothetical protein
MTQFQDWILPVLTEQQTGRLADLFQILPGQIQLVQHPLNNDRSLLKITFLYGINVAAALASFFNDEFYCIPDHERVHNLSFKENAYAFIDSKQKAEVLCLTVAEPIASLLERLDQHKNDLRYVMTHPQILFMMRPDLDFQTARANLQRSF